MNRRVFLNLSTRIAATAFVGSACLRPAWSQSIGMKDILHDPDAPVSGNLKGDVTIVAFLDYNCPFCKQSAPDLERIVKTDAKIRLVYKDWPILTEASVYGAQLALAAKYQDRYETVHKALMAIPGRGISKEKMVMAATASGVDMARLQADMMTHDADIKALLKRNLAQADALGIQGTPTYLVGPFKTSTLDYVGFKQAVADARASQAKRK